MLEAKGPGFWEKMNTQNGWQDWFTGGRKMENQMRNQSMAAFGRTVEWHFAEKPAAEFLRKFAAQNRLSNIVVIYTPPESP